MQTTRITTEQVSQWVGSDFAREDFIKLLAELANGDYLAEHFANDIVATDDEEFRP